MKYIENKHFVLDYDVLPSWKSRIKGKVKNIFLSLLYKVRIKFINIPTIQNKKYKVSICAIFKNEANYLKEWIEFNHIIGIEHFYLYNNNSEDDYISVLQPYIDSGLVTLIQWEKNYAQMECYNNCIERFKNDTQWIGFIDIDEFIVPKSTHNIYDFLKSFEKKCGSVKIYWKMYGTSGLMDRDLNSLVIEKFVVSWPKYYSVGKCFYNTSFDFDYKDKRNNTLHHKLWTKYKGKSIPPVNVFNKICLDNMDLVKDDNHPIQINHYFTKSYKEYLEKRKKGDVFFENNPHDLDYFFLHESENTSVDYSAYKYLIKLKKSMKIGEIKDEEI